MIDALAKALVAGGLEPEEFTPSGGGRGVFSGDAADGEDCAEFGCFVEGGPVKANIGRLFESLLRAMR
jgi:hypothetical protein